MFSWHSNTLKELLALGERLPHAVLLQAPAGTGVVEFGTTWAQSLLCEAQIEGGEACGRCPACRWFEQGNHPDFRLVQPESLAPTDPENEPAKEKKSDQIRIEQVRALQGFLTVGTHRSKWRVVLLHPADTMNPATQNALLKSLEEPPARTVFILATSEPHRLLPTVRSRCRSVLLPAPAHPVALEWLKSQGVVEAEAALQLAGGAPLAALGSANRLEWVRSLTRELGNRKFDPISLAAACQGIQPAEFVTSLYRWCYDLLSIQLAGSARYHPDQERALRGLAAGCRPQRLAGFLRQLAEARSLAQHPLNPRLVFEDLLIRYSTAIQSRAEV